MLCAKTPVIVQKCRIKKRPGLPARAFINSHTDAGVRSRQHPDSRSLLLDGKVF